MEKATELRFLQPSTVPHNAFVEKAIQAGRILLVANAPDLAVPAPVRFEIEDGSVVFLKANGEAVRQSPREGESVAGFGMALHIWCDNAPERLGVFFIPEEP